MANVPPSKEEVSRVGSDPRDLGPDGTVTELIKPPAVVAGRASPTAQRPAALLLRSFSKQSCCKLGDHFHVDATSVNCMSDPG